MYPSFTLFVIEYFIITQNTKLAQTRTVLHIAIQTPHIPHHPYRSYTHTIE